MDSFEEWYAENIECTGEQSMTDEQRWRIADLIEAGHFTDEYLDGIKIFFMGSPSFDDANRLISDLIEMMPPQVTHGNRLPSQHETSNFIKKICGLTK